MDDPISARAFRRVRNNPDSEYSVGVVPNGAIDYRDEEDGNRTVIFHSLRVPEYSPVIMGADVDTYTVETNAVAIAAPPEPVNAPPEGMDAIMARIMQTHMEGYRYA